MAASSNLDIWTFTRAGDIDPNPSVFASRAQQWAQSTPTGTILIAAKVGNSMRTYMVAPRSSGSSNAAVYVAQAVAAKAVPVTDDADTDLSAILDTPAISMLSFETGAMMQRDPIVGADPAEISRQLSLALRDGEWVALSTRKPTKKENKRYREWLSMQLGTKNPNHASQNTNAVVVNIWAGAQDQNESDARAMNLAAALRGFDVPVVPKRVTRTGQVLRFASAAFVGALVAAVGLVPSFVPELPEGFANLSPVFLALGALIGGVGLLGAVGTGVGLLPSYAKRVRQDVARGVLPAPRERHGRWHRPVDQHTDRRTGAIVPPVYGDYPLHENSFLHGAEIFVGVIAPHSGADAGSSGVAERKVTSEMRECVGFRVGINDRLPTYLSAIDMRQSISIFGRRGSGKSHLTHGIFGWMSLDKAHPSGKRGYTGPQNTMIAFETKSSGGAQEYVDRTMHTLGITDSGKDMATLKRNANIYEVGLSKNVPAAELEPYRVDHEEYAARVAVKGAIPLRIDIANPDGIGIDVFDLPGFTVRERAEFVTSALKYVYGESSIQGHSTEVLDDIFAAAFSVDAAIAAQIDRVETDRSPFYYASILLGSRGDDLAVALATEIRSEAARRGDDSPELADASENLDKYFVGVTQAKRQTSMEAPRNKVKNLLSMEQWWSRKQRYSWKTLIDNNVSVVVNTASYTGPNAANVSDGITEAMGQFLLFSLKQSIERNCDGNAYREKFVTIFSDELSMLASDSSDVITWLQDKGRSFGVICVFASQRVEQLTPEVQKAVLGFGTVVLMNQQDVDIARKLVALLSFGGNEWSEGDIINLEPHHAIIRTLFEDRSVPPFNVAIDDYFAPDYDFAALNGYALTT